MVEASSPRPRRVPRVNGLALFPGGELYTLAKHHEVSVLMIIGFQFANQLDKWVRSN